MRNKLIEAASVPNLEPGENLRSVEQKNVWGPPRRLSPSEIVFGISSQEIGLAVGRRMGEIFGGVQTQNPQSFPNELDWLIDGAVIKVLGSRKTSGNDGSS